MGNERLGYRRMTFFLHDNIALQMAEDAHKNHESLAEYMTNAIIKRIDDERTEKLKDAQKSM